MSEGAGVDVKRRETQCNTVVGTGARIVDSSIAVLTSGDSSPHCEGVLHCRTWRLACENFAITRVT